MNQLPASVQYLLEHLREAKYPATYDVDESVASEYEDWLIAEKDRRRAEWEAAGSPEEWHEDLWPICVGKHFGLMLKGVELLVRRSA